MKSNIIIVLFKKKTKQLILFVSLLLIATLLYGCDNDKEDISINDISVWIKNQVPSYVDEDIILPDKHPDYGGEITWESMSPHIITDTGIILINDSTQEVVLKYTIKYISDSLTDYITTSVVGVNIDKIAEVFSKQFNIAIARDYNITTSYMDYYNVEWSSSNPDIFSNTGKYTAPFFDTNITISYEVTSINKDKKEYNKDLLIIGMNLNQKEDYVTNYIKDYFNSNFVISEDTILPTSIDINGVNLKWLDPNKKEVTSLKDVSSYIIPRIGVFLTCVVTTKTSTFSFEILFESISKNENFKFRNITSWELIKEMRVGWNLGNTFDAPSETAWSNPRTTKQMIDEVKKAGFNVIRFPVTWEGHFDPITYKIDEAYISRVQEVLNYIIDKDTFVILNMHHERWNSTSYANKDKASLIMENLWTQIGTRFASYDEHLIFEGMNEPRIYEASDSIQWGGNQESFDCINHLNNVFVNTIRGLGGNNRYRHLMITTNGAGTSEAILSNLDIINDDYVIVSVHAYTPYDFAHDKTTITSWSESNLSQTKSIDDVFNRLNNYFISKGIPVIMGEFASRDKNNLSSRLAWLEYYLDKADSLGIPCVWWDTGQFKSDENMTFSIFNRNTLEWLFPEIVEMLVSKTK